MKLISSNKKAGFDYFLTNNLECGIVLVGSEVKNIIQHSINLKESYVKIILTADGRPELFLLNAHVDGVFGTWNDKWGTRTILKAGYEDNKRPRKLLLHKKEIKKFVKLMQDPGTTILCTKAYIDDNGKIKCEIALGRGKKQHDKRNVIKERDLMRRA
jgi:SsrA-binding protein